MKLKLVESILTEDEKNDKLDGYSEIINATLKKYNIPIYWIEDYLDIYESALLNTTNKKNAISCLLFNLLKPFREEISFSNKIVENCAVKFAEYASNEKTYYVQGVHFSEFMKRYSVVQLLDAKLDYGTSDYFCSVDDSATTNLFFEINNRGEHGPEVKEYTYNFYSYVEDTPDFFNTFKGFEEAYPDCYSDEFINTLDSASEEY